MAIAPTFLGTLLLLVLPLVIAVGVLAYAGTQGTGAFQKQGVAWVITAVMVIAAIGIGYGKAHASNGSEPAPDFQPGSSPALETVPPDYSQATAAYIRDDANVLSAATEKTLADRNFRLLNRYGAAIGVVTCNYGRDGLDRYAVQRAGEMGLGGNDLIVVLDIRGDDYWLAVGDDLTEDCSDYAWMYMEEAFAAGDYDSAVLKLTQALEDWYNDYFN